MSSFSTAFAVGGQRHNIEGCLNGLGGNYTLTPDGTGMVFKLRQDEACYFLLQAMSVAMLPSPLSDFGTVMALVPG
jgi:hypothetical protein